MSSTDDKFKPLYVVNPDVGQDSSGFRRVTDLGVDAARGAIGLGKGIIGLGDLATGGLIGSGARAVGYNPDEADAMVADLYSKQRKRAEQEVEQADGFLGTAGAMLKNPSTIVGAAIQSAPNLLGGAGAARGLAMGVERAAMKSALARGLTGEAAEAYAQRAATRYLATGAGESAAKTAAAVGDGLLTAGGIAEDIRSKNPDDIASMYYAVPAGIITGAISRGGSRFEGGGIEAAIGTGGRAGAVKGGVLRRFGKGAAGEAIEEGLQSPQEQVWQNLATNEQDLLKGTGKAAAQGALAGGLSGGFFHAVTPDAHQHAPMDMLKGGEIIAPTESATPTPQIGQAINNVPTMSMLDRINQITGVTRPAAPEGMRNDRKSMLSALEEPTGLYGTDENGQEIQLDAGRAAAMAAGLQPLSQDDLKARQKKGAVTPDQVNYLYEKFGQPTPAINPVTGEQDGVEWHGEHFGIGQDAKLAAKQAALSQAESKKTAGQREAELTLSKVLREDSGAAHLTQKDFNQYVKPFSGASNIQSGVGRMLHESSALSKLRINLGKEMVNLQDEAKGNPQKVEELRKQLGIYNKWLEAMGFDAVEPIYPKAKQEVAPKAQPKQEGAVAQAEKAAVVRTKRNGELITKSREQVVQDIANMSDTHKEWLKYIVGERKAGNSVTYDDVANHFGVSKQAVSKALTKREITQDVINRISTDSDAVMARVEAQQRVGDAVVKAREEMGPKARQWLDYMVAERNAGRPVTTQSIAEHFGADLGKVRDAFIRYKLTDKSFAQVANDSQSMHVKDTDPVLSDLLGGTGEEGADKATGYRIAAGEGEVNSDDIITESQSTKSRLLSQAGKLVEASKKAAARGKSESADKLSTAAKLLMDRAVGASTESTEEDTTTTNVKGAKAAAAAMVRKGQVANINGQDEISTRARNEYMQSLEPGQAPDKIALMQHIEQAHKDAEVEKRTRDYYLRQDIEDKRQAEAEQQRAEADNAAANSVHKDRAIREWNVSAEDNEPEYNQLTQKEQRDWQLAYLQYQESLRMGEESIEELQALLEQDRKDILDGRAQLNEQQQLTDDSSRAGSAGQIRTADAEDRQTDTRGPGSGEILHANAGENSQAAANPVRSTPVGTVKKRRTIAKTSEGSQGSEGRDVTRTIDEINSGTNPDVGKHGNVSKTEFKNGTEAAKHLASTFKDGRLASLARLLAPQLASVEVKFVEKGETIHFDDGTVDQELTDRMAAGVGGVSVLTNDTGRIQIFMNKASPLGLDKVALLHELVHAATQAKLDSVKGSDLHKNLAVIAMQLQADLAGRDSGVDGSSFFSKVVNSPDELLAYALTSPTFYEYANRKYVSGTLAPEATKQTLWQRFVAAVQKMLGIKQADAPALDRAIKPIYVTDRNTGRTLNEELDATLRHILTSDAKTPAKTSVGQQTRQEVNHSGLTAEQTRSATNESNDPTEVEARTVESAMAGKDPIAAAQWLSENAPNPAHKVVATAVAKALSRIAEQGVKLNPIKVAHIGDSIPRALLGARGLNSYVFGRDDTKAEMTVWLNGSDVSGKVGTSYEVALHELTHMATVASVRLGNTRAAQGTPLQHAVSRLYDVTRTAIDTINTRIHNMKRGGTELTEFERQMYEGRNNALANPDEVLTWALTNKQAQEFLNSIDYPESKRSLWDVLVDAVRSVLGLPVRANSALAEVLSIGKDILETDQNGVKSIAGMVGTNFAIAKGREKQAEANIAKLPAPLQKPVNRIWDTLTNGYKTGVYIGSFTRDLLEKAAGMMDHAKEYADTLDKKETLRHQMQSRLESIMQMAAPLTNGERNRLNMFLKDSTMSQKWGFVPAHDDSVEVDPTMRGKFEALPSTAQEVAKAIFAHGHEILQQKQAILDREIKAEYADRIAEAKDAKEVAKLEKERDKLLETYSGRLSKLDGPYAPLKRFGNYVVVARSKEYMDAYKNKDAEAIRNMESDAQHNLVQFADTYAEAKAMERDLKATGKYAGDGVHAFEKAKNRDAIYGDSSEMFHAFSKLKAMISTDDKKSSNYLDRLVSDLYLSTMAENSARRSEMTRKNIAGADNDMLKAFATQGSADISFIAALSHNNEITKHLALMNDSAHDHTEGREERVKLFNEILARHADRMNYVPAPIQNKVMALTSIWMLATSPAYYIQNSLQTAMVTAPYLAGKFGASAHAAISKAYTDLVPSMKDGIADTAKLTKGERDMYKRLTEVGLIDNGVGNELGKWARDGSENKVFSGVIDKLRGLTNKVEYVNRTVAAVAAYRLALPKLGHEGAVQYARDAVLRTHGDYSGFNAPRFMSNNFMPGAKLITQFRKYQIIQMSLLGRLARESFSGATPEERAVARKSLAWIMGHTAVMAGGLGLPFVNGFAWALGKAFGDDDTPDDPEVMLRKLIGNKQAADLILGGVPKALGLGMTNKLGLDKVYSLSPFNDIDVTNRKGMEKTIVGLAGPAASLSIKASDSLALFGQGDYYKGLENLMPSGIANVSKAYRFGTEGVTQRNGDVVLTPQEISLVDALFQGIGLQTNTLADRTADANAVKSYEVKYKDKLDNLTHRYAAAYKSGDGEAMASVREKFAQLQQSQRENGFKVTPLSTLLRAPIDQVKRERNVVGGVEFSNRNRGFVNTVTSE